MGTPKRASRLLSSICVLALAACSGGGGGGSAAISTGAGAGTTGASTSGSTTGGTTTGGTSTGSTSTGGTSTGSTGSATTTPTVSIGAPDKADVAIGAPYFNFTNNLPAVGTKFGLFGPAVKVGATSVQAAGTTLNSSATYRGMVTSGSTQVPTFDINIPEIGLTATSVRADGTTMILADGSKVVLKAAFLNYSEAGGWAYIPAGSGPSYTGVFAGGFGTPAADVPVAGTATYSGNGTAGGGVSALYFVPSGTGSISTGSLNGSVALSVNFSTGAVSGTLSNMTATPGDGGAATPWNTVNLSASINRLATNASFTGTTSTGDAPAGAGSAGFSSAATGGLSGAFFGPGGIEAGGSFTLTDPNAAGGGKTAFGSFGATGTACSGCSTATASTGSSGSTASGGTSGSTAVTINAADTPATGGVSSPSFNFTSNPPTLGTKLTLVGAVVSVTPTTVTGAGHGDGVTATFRGTVAANGVTYPVFDLDAPSLSLHAQNVRGDGTPVTLFDGGVASAAVATLNYTLLGAWTFKPGNGGPSYFGQTVTGSLTPASSVPTSGSATYTGSGNSGGVVGAFFVPSGSGSIQAGSLSGDMSLTVNFAAATVNGSLTHMTATTAANGSGTTPWNDVSLSGRLPPGVNYYSGTTTTTGAPSGAGNAGFSSAATGSFIASFYGPGAPETGGTWTLHESTANGGKTAIGTFAGSIATP